MTKTSDNLPIKVCFVCPKAYPLFNHSVKEYFAGAEVDLYLLATELAKDANFSVSFIVADYGQSPIESRDDVTVIKSLDFRKNALSGAFDIWRALKQADADIYMLKTASLGVPLVACFCNLHNKVFTYRTASIPECDGRYRKQHFFLGAAFYWSLRQAKMVFVQNDSDKENLLRTVGLSAIVISNGHRLTQPEQNQRSSILWVGRSDRIKGPMRFVELASQFSEEKFVMICQKATGDKNYDHLRSQAEDVSNIEFHKQVPFHEVDRFFQRAKVLVNTSDYEGFSNTFIQACKCATPILSFNVNPDNFLNRYSCGIFCEGDEQRLSEALEFLLAENRYTELGQNARKYAEKYHDITKIVKQYKKLFVELAEQSFTEPK